MEVLEFQWATGSGRISGPATPSSAPTPPTAPTPRLDPEKLVERIVSNYGFRVRVDPSWSIETGGAGIRVHTPEGRFHVLRTPAPSKLGVVAKAPGDQVAAATKRVAGTEILCTVDPGASDALLAIASQICETTEDLGPLGFITKFLCEGDDDIDIEASSASVESHHEDLKECFTAGHRADPAMKTGSASLGILPSPDGVPLTILAGADVPDERSFLWMRGCLTSAARSMKFPKLREGDGMVRCDVTWNLE